MNSGTVKDVRTIDLTDDDDDDDDDDTSGNQNGNMEWKNETIFHFQQEVHKNTLQSPSTCEYVRCNKFHDLHKIQSSSNNACDQKRKDQSICEQRRSHL